MGLFCVNFHFRSVDDAALAAALAKRRIKDHRIARPKNGWTSLYEERASQQDDARIRDLAGGLSRDLKAAAIAFLVHDSDIACYWLYDQGQLVDEYNSCPGYFEDDRGGDHGPSGGRTDVLVKYCRPGVSEDDLASILTGNGIFAEGVIEQLADALGIDPARALADYRDEDGEGDGDGDDEDGDDDGPPPLKFPPGGLAGLAGMFGAGGPAADSKAVALVQAAADGDGAGIDRALADGAAIEAEAPASLAGSPTMSGFVQAMPAAAPKIPMSPLLAAVVNRRRAAAERLLDRGADPNRPHPLFGTTVHAAAAAGDAETLGLLLDRGGDPTARNVRGETPLQALATVRTARERMLQAQQQMKAMGVQIPGLADKFAGLTQPNDGWDVCERLLQSRGGR